MFNVCKAASCHACFLSVEHGCGCNADTLLLRNARVRAVQLLLLVHSSVLVLCVVRQLRYSGTSLLMFAVRHVCMLFSITYIVTRRRAIARVMLRSCRRQQLMQ
jgi:hypothetical protein